MKRKRYVSQSGEELTPPAFLCVCYKLSSSSPLCEVELGNVPIPAQTVWNVQLLGLGHLKTV